MNIPPKYEDVVEKLDAALAREAALREDLVKLADDYCEKVDDILDLQQRLTVAEQRLSQVEGACDLVMSAIDDDERGANFVKIIQAIKDKAALNPAADAGFSSSEFTKKSGKSARAPVGLKKDQIVEVFGGGQTQIERVDKTDWRHVEMWRVKP